MSYIIDIFTGKSGESATVIWPLIIGAFLAVIISHFNKRTVGILVKRLLDSKANTPENAKKLNDLGLGKKAYLKYALRPKSTLRGIIFAEKDAYYIPEETEYRAETVYKPDGSSLLTVFSAFVFFLIIGLALVNSLPNIIGFASSIF